MKTTIPFCSQILAAYDLINKEGLADAYSSLCILITQALAENLDITEQEPATIITSARQKITSLEEINFRQAHSLFTRFALEPRTQKLFNAFQAISAVSPRKLPHSAPTQISTTSNATSLEPLIETLQLTETWARTHLGELKKHHTDVASQGLTPIQKSFVISQRLLGMPCEKFIGHKQVQKENTLKKLAELLRQTANIQNSITAHVVSSNNR